jgi:hypothetical protein
MRSSGLAGCFGLLAVAAFLGGCAEPSITLTAGKTQLCAGGYDKTDITALVKISGGKKKAGVIVSFSLDGEGSFNSDSSSPLTSKDVATVADGTAVVTLYAGNNAGADATVTASFTDNESGDSASANLTIKIVTPQPGCGGAPTSRSLNFYCDAVNIGALRVPMPDIAVPCHVEAATHDGQAIPAEAMEIDFLLEAGSMEAATDYDGHRYFLYHPSGGSRTAPVAVTPSQDLFEPSRFDVNGKEHCPRQGLVTLVAVVRGEESWVDTNGNGQYDPGVDTFDDIAEPFLDMNDNGERDTRVDVEEGEAISEDYVDTNDDGLYSDANGKWDADTKIWAVTHILWTGASAIEQKTGDAVATHYTLSANSANIAAGGNLDVSLYLRDENMNPVAGFDGQGSSDYVQFDSPEGIVTLNPYTRAMTQQIGFTINNDGSIEGDSFFKTESPYRVRLSTTEGYTGDYTVTFTVVATPGPAGEDYYLDQITDLLNLTLSGKVQ